MSTRKLTPQELVALAPEIDKGHAHAIAAQYHERKAQKSHARLARLKVALFGKNAVIDANDMTVTLPDIAPVEGSDGS